MKRVHEAVKWGLGGAVIEGHYLPERGSTGLVAGMTEGVIRLFLDLLVKQVELDLKQMLVLHLRRREGPNWWSSLPEAVQRLARARHRWSQEALGARRITRFPDVSWLTFGDVLKVLDSISPDEWTMCLRAEAMKRQRFRAAAKRIKAFRDYYIAHPKPRDLTTPEIASLCQGSRRLPEALCPNQWKQACSIVRHDRHFLLPDPSRNGAAAASAPVTYRRSLLKWWDANYGDWTKWKKRA